MITKLKLENWRSHHESEFEFNNGTNVLVGKMGAGKSSVINAICYSLFGTFPALNRKETTLNAIIMNKPFEADECKSTLEFIWNNKTYKVERLILKGTKSNQAKLYENEKLIAGPQVSQVNAEIEKLLETDYDLFFRAVFSEQNGLDQFLKLTPQQRKESFDKLLSLDKYENARKNAVSVLNSLKRKQKDLKEIISEIDLEDLSNKKKTYQKEVKSQEKELTILEKKEKEKTKESKEIIGLIEKEEKEKEKYNKLKENLSQNNALFENLQKEILSVKQNAKDMFNIKNSNEAKEKILKLESDLKKRKTSLKEQEKKITEMKERKKLILELEEEIKEIQSNLPEKINNKKDCEKKTKTLNDEFIAIQENSSKLDKELEKEQKRSVELEKENSALESKLEELIESIKSLSKEKGTCPVCSKPLKQDEREKILKEKQLEIEKIKKSINENEKNFLKIEELLSNIKESKQNSQTKEKELLNELSGMQTIISQIETLNKKQITLKEKSKSIKEVKIDSSLENEISTFEELLVGLKEIEKTLSKQQTLEKMQIEKKSILIKLKTIKFNEEDFLKINTKKETLIQEIGFISEQIKTKQESVTEKKEFLKTIEKRLENSKKTLEKIKKLENKTSDLALFISALKETQSTLRESLIKSGNKAMNLVWQEIYPYGDYKSCKLEIEQGEYHVKVLNNLNKWVEVEQTLSGGERAAAALTLRIAFSLVLAGHLGILFLDEPTHNLDEEAVMKITNMMKSSLPGLISQVFVITHHKEMEKAATSKLYRLDREKTLDQPTQIEQAEIF